MKEELEYEFNCFLQDMEHGVTFGKYFDEDAYEYEYSHNQIDEFQDKFREKVIDWLRKNIPGKYLVSSGYCILVMTEEEARKRKLWDIEDSLIR